MRLHGLREEYEINKMNTDIRDRLIANDNENLDRRIKTNVGSKIINLFFTFFFFLRNVLPRRFIFASEIQIKNRSLQDFKNVIN